MSDARRTRSNLDLCCSDRINALDSTAYFYQASTDGFAEMFETSSSPHAAALKFAPHVSTSYLSLILSALLVIFAMSTYDNPLIWEMWWGNKNKRADLGGKLFSLTFWVAS